MSTQKVNRFAKTRSCPPAKQLLSISLAAIPTESNAELVSHLEVCEFCCTEAHFLSQFHESTLTTVAAGMPASLHLLAKAVLGMRNGGSADTLVQLLRTPEELI